MLIKEKIFKLMKTIDIYGFNFPLRYKKETQYNTLCGSFFSIISISIIILISFLYFKKMVQRTNFSLVTNYIYTEDNLEIDLSNFPLMIGLINYDGQIEIDDSYITFKLEKNVYTPTKNELGYSLLKRTSYQIELEKCTLNNFGKYQDLFKKYDYRKNLCVKQNQNLTIKGRNGDQVKGYTTLEMHLIKCENSTIKNNYFCKNEEDIDKFLLNSYVSFFYISQTTNHFNITHPIYNLLNSNTYAINIGHVKRYFVFFSNDIYLSDSGLIFDKSKEFNLFQYHHTHFDFLEKDHQQYFSGKTLIEISLTCHDIKTEYNRVYIKIQDVLGYIGGIYDIISIFFQFISYNFVKKSFINGIGNFFISSNCKNLTINSYKNSIDKSNFALKNNFKCNISTIPFKIKKIDDINICTVFNIKVKNQILNLFDVNENELKLIQNFEKTEKNWYYYLLYYIVPLYTLKHFQKYKIFNLYINIFHRFLSIDFFIPIILKSYQSLNDLNNL
jgi:hypothetical protein